MVPLGGREEVSREVVSPGGREVVSPGGREVKLRSSPSSTLCPIKLPCRLKFSTPTSPTSPENRRFTPVKQQPRLQCSAQQQALLWPPRPLPRPGQPCKPIVQPPAPTKTPSQKRRKWQRPRSRRKRRQWTMGGDSLLPCVPPCHPPPRFRACGSKESVWVGGKGLVQCLFDNLRLHHYITK